MICLVTDRHRLVAGSRLRLGETVRADRLVDLVGEAALAGVDLIQVRERDLEARELAALVRRCVDAARGTMARIVVNDRADVALAAGAHGVHLRSDSIDAPAVRTLMPSAFIGRSVHGADEAAAVSRLGGLDYMIVGTMFATPSKDGSEPLTTIDELTDACRASAVPVLAIGGITIQRAPMMVRAGAAGIAAIGLFIPPEGESPRRHVASVVASLRRVFDTCGTVT
jgi:thiamine-phosphate pyrophosphorylase